MTTPIIIEPAHNQIRIWASGRLCLYADNVRIHKWSRVIYLSTDEAGPAAVNGDRLVGILDVPDAEIKIRPGLDQWTDNSGTMTVITMPAVKQ